MVVVKVRETYDLKTVKNKMTVIGIHTPDPVILKKNYPGLLMQCRAYRPVDCDVRIACASVLPLDPLGVGTSENAVSPEDVFNPILYKAMSNKGMSQLEARITAEANGLYTPDLVGAAAFAESDDVGSGVDDFNIYYGLLSNTHDWKHAHPQSGLEMRHLKPLVYEMVYNFGDSKEAKYPVAEACGNGYPGTNVGGSPVTPVLSLKGILGNAKAHPWLNCTSYTEKNTSGQDTMTRPTGFFASTFLNAEIEVPWIKVMCGCIIVPPSRLHELFFRMVVEWRVEFSMIRPLGEITNLTDLARIGDDTHLQSYSYTSVKEAIAGDSEEVLKKDTCMVSSSSDINKVM